MTLNELLDQCLDDAVPIKDAIGMDSQSFYTKEDQDSAIDRAEKIIEGNGPNKKNALYFLGDYHLSNCGLKKENLERSLAYFSEACALEYAPAISRLGFVKLDYKFWIEQETPAQKQSRIAEGLEFIKRAVALEEPYAMLNYAKIFEVGMFGVDKDTAKAAALYRKIVCSHTFDWKNINFSGKVAQSHLSDFERRQLVVADFIARFFHAKNPAEIKAVALGVDLSQCKPLLAQHFLSMVKPLAFQNKAKALALFKAALNPANPLGAVFAKHRGIKFWGDTRTISFLRVEQFKVLLSQWGLEGPITQEEHAYAVEHKDSLCEALISSLNNNDYIIAAADPSTPLGKIIAEPRGLLFKTSGQTASSKKIQDFIKSHSSDEDNEEPRSRL